MDTAFPVAAPRWIDNRFALELYAADPLPAAISNGDLLILSDSWTVETSAVAEQVPIGQAMEDQSTPGGILLVALQGIMTFTLEGPPPSFTGEANAIITSAVHGHAARSEFGGGRGVLLEVLPSPDRVTVHF